MVPVAEVPPQDIGPWREALARLLGDRAHYEEIAAVSQAAARSYADGLSVGPFEDWLGGIVRQAGAARAVSTRVRGGGDVLLQGLRGIISDVSRVEIEVNVPEKGCAGRRWENDHASLRWRRRRIVSRRAAQEPGIWFPFAYMHC